MFKAAIRSKLKGRVAIDGPSGSGKTYTGLRFAHALAAGGKVAVVDTEHGAASKYVGESPDGVTWNFDTCELVHFAPTTYSQVIAEAGRQGYAALLVDSLSHAWEGVGGALDQVDKSSGNSFTAWKDVTPQHRQMIEAILSFPGHIICTMRTKTEYVLEEQKNRSGKTVMAPRRVGMAPIQRSGMEYEFDLVCDMDLQHTLKVSKARCPAVDSAMAVKPDAAFLAPFIQWLDAGNRGNQNPQYSAAGKPADPAPPSVKLSGKQDTKPEAASRGQNDPCGDEIAGQIKQAAKTLEMPVEKLREIISRYGASSVAEIPQGPAMDLLHKLTVRVQEKQSPF